MWGSFPTPLDVDTATNQIYVANECGDDPNCASTATMTVIDGATLATTEVMPSADITLSRMAVNSVTNKIYVPSNCFGDPSCQAPNGTVSVIDGGTLAYRQR